jgi:PKD domain
VDNVRPTIAISGAATVNEGSTYTLTLGAITDPGEDTVTSWVVHWGDGETDTYSAGGDVTHTYADGPNTYAVTVDLVDEDDTHVDRANDHSVQVDNVAPAVTAPANQTADEGTATSFSLGSFLDPGDDDPWQVTVDWGDGSTDTVFTEATPGPIAATMHTYADDGLFTVTVTVDEDNGAGADGSATFQVTVANVPPEVTAPADQNAGEGTAHVFELGSFTDPGDDDPWRVTVDWGDGSTDSVFTESSPGAITDTSHTYADDGLYTVTVTVTEENGTAASGSATFGVDVANVAPAITPPAAQTANEGASTTFDLGSFTDPGADSPWRVTVDWGDLSPDTVFAETNPGAIADKPHTYADNGTYTVTITVEEEAGTGPGSDSATFQVGVANVNPTVTITAPPSGTYPVGVPIPVNASFTDPGTLDTHTCTINGNAGTVAEANGSGTCSGSATPTSAGSFTITVVVTDDDGGSGTASVTVNALYAIYAHERCSGGSGKGLIVNGDNADIDGGIHSNGNLTLNGSNFNSATLSLYRPQSGCTTTFNPSRVNFGPPSPTAPVNVPQQNWPWNPPKSQFPCTYTKDEHIFNKAGQTILPGVYCATKTFKINASNVSGNITVVAPEIVINGKNINLSAFKDGMLLYGTSSKEIVVDSDFTPDTTATLSGLVHNPGGGVKINGQAVHLHRGFLQGLWVEVNLKGFRMTY